VELAWDGHCRPAAHAFYERPAYRPFQVCHTRAVADPVASSQPSKDLPLKISARKSYECGAELLVEAQVAQFAGRYRAAVLCAIHAGIQADRAARAARAGRGTPDMAPHALMLRELLFHERVLGNETIKGDMKRPVGDERRLAAGEESAAALDKAERMVSWAREVVKQERL
jgi:hypothetical protein